MPINLTGPAMEVARIGSILKASKAKQAEEAAKAEQKKLNEARAMSYKEILKTTGNLAALKDWENLSNSNNPNNQNTHEEWTKLFVDNELHKKRPMPPLVKAKWVEPMAKKGLESTMKAQDAIDAVAKVRVAHKENVYKGGKRF